MSEDLVGWKKDYLEELRRDHTLCLPRLDLPALADRLSIPLRTLTNRRKRSEPLRAAERDVIAEHVGRLRAEAVRAGKPVLTGEDEDLPAHLERYMELYTDPGCEGTYDQRFKALRALQDEGVPIEWQDILDAMVSFPAFKAAMDRHWQEGHVDAEDSLRMDARKGKAGARALYLRSNMAEKYGNKVKVEVETSHRLDDADRRLVEEVKGQIGGRAKPREPYLLDVVESKAVS